VALDDPLRRPYSERDELKRFSQHEVDVIDTKNNIFKIISFEDIVKEKLSIDIDRIALKDYEAMRMMSERGAEEKDCWILTLDNVFSDNALTDSFGKILKSLEDAYCYPVEIEFTVNFTSDNKFKINILQCRPLQTRGLGAKKDMPSSVNRDDILFQAHGNFLGGNISQNIKRVIYVDLKKYSELVQSDKYEIARMVGALNREIEDKEKLPTLLMGPGRWGTTTPSLGIPVRFAEINNITVLAEVASSTENIMPELSFGTHFFQDLVETNIFYVALFPEKENSALNQKWFAGSENLFLKLMPQYTKYKNVISVYDVGDRNLKIMSDIVSQKIICFSERSG
jgi:hypothetical protein